MENFFNSLLTNLPDCGILYPVSILVGLHQEDIVEYQDNGDCHSRSTDVAKLND